MRGLQKPFWWKRSASSKLQAFAREVQLFLPVLHASASAGPLRCVASFLGTGGLCSIGSHLEHPIPSRYPQREGFAGIPELERAARCPWAKPWSVVFWKLKVYEKHRLRPNLLLSLHYPHLLPWIEEDHQCCLKSPFYC